MAKKAMETDATVVEMPVSKYTREQLMSATQFQKRRDLVSVLAGENESVSIAEMQSRIDKFMKGKVK